MDGMDVQILAMRPDQVRAVGEVFADSHAEYPAFRHVFPDPRARAAALRAFFTATARDALRAGVVHVAVAGDRLVGAAIWLPPGAFPWTPARKLRSTGMLVSVLRASPRSFMTFARLGSNAERLHPRDPHWNLEALGVRSEAQGRGLGARLVRPMLAHIDRMGLPCYLTTARAENVPFYERLGFHVEDAALPLVPHGPTHWGMRRPAAPRLQGQPGVMNPGS